MKEVWKLVNSNMNVEEYTYQNESNEDDISQKDKT